MSDIVNSQWVTNSGLEPLDLNYVEQESKAQAEFGRKDSSFTVSSGFGNLNRLMSLKKMGTSFQNKKPRQVLKNP